MKCRRFANMKPAFLSHHRKIKKLKTILKNEMGAFKRGRANINHNRDGCATF
ncbi:MAG: hypothetical protein GX927_05845 [Lentisphaerae bacterium]|nr:hypothetical protein [Lentisphaerota bacterium]